MRVLVLGSGGREHALAWAIGRSPQVDEVLCAPGSDGIAACARCLPVELADNAAIVDLAKREGVDLVVVGPEDPLVRGVADALREAGIACFGPSAEAAQLEGSKSFAKAFMERHGVPTASGESFDDADAALAWVRERGGRVVVKADGLAAGKGVYMCETPDDAEAAIDEIMRDQRFGKAGSRVVLEQWLDGEEASYYALSDGERFVCLAPAQDHKRALDGDRGENTGGMGAYAPAPVVTPEVERKILERVVRPVIDGMRAEGRPYRGVLYVGLMIDRAGDPSVIEFNARFGDPETEPLLFGTDADLVPLLVAAARGELPADAPALPCAPTVCVVVASEGYPRDYPTGRAITGLDARGQLGGAQVFHAGSARRDGGWETRGGRVLCITARAADLGAARDAAYAAIAELDFEGMQYRRDIAARAFGRRER